MKGDTHVTPSPANGELRLFPRTPNLTGFRLGRVAVAAASPQHDVLRRRTHPGGLELASNHEARPNAKVEINNAKLRKQGDGALPLPSGA